MKLRQHLKINGWKTILFFCDTAHFHKLAVSFGSVDIKNRSCIFPALQVHYLTNPNKAQKNKGNPSQNLHTFALVDPPKIGPISWPLQYVLIHLPSWLFFRCHVRFQTEKKQRRRLMKKLRSSDFSRIFVSWNLMFDLIDPSGQMEYISPSPRFPWNTGDGSEIRRKKPPGMVLKPVVNTNLNLLQPPEIWSINRRGRGAISRFPKS